MSRPTTLSIRLELLLPAAAIQNSKKTDLFKVIGIAVASGGNSKFEKKGRSTDKDPSIQLELLLPPAAIQNSKKKMD